ncbi:hypothetical protein FGG08_001117 [Glutinoglossum americanum]|uniref:PNPLA domain-containing protein n=1 Tax=Glutinoglossum americanum TaxID=1670608 RepID=A0A9P8IBN8_9PEZI|nr:hypothetical protein FGG08_001117 [Glutinoglossum americanum]
MSLSSTTHQSDPQAPASLPPPTRASQPPRPRVTSPRASLLSQSPEQSGDEESGVRGTSKPKPKSRFNTARSSSLRGGRKNTPDSRKSSHVSFEQQPGVTLEEPDIAPGDGEEEITLIKDSGRVETGISSGSADSTASSVVPEIWVKQYVLSFDGGGVRGYSSLLIVREIMQIIENIERNGCNNSGGGGNDDAEGWDPAYSSYHPHEPLEPTTSGSESEESGNGNGGNHAAGKRPAAQHSQYLPCHYFDYIGGTSTGGLIGIMLGRLRMNINDCITEYETLGDQVFGHPRIASIRGPIPAFREKYDCTRLKRVVEGVVRRRLKYRPDAVAADMFPSHETMCKTIVVSYQQKMAEDGDLDQEPAFLFRTYDHHPSNPKDPLERNPGLAHRVPIWEVARATSAAPTYFDAITVSGRKFGDGGFGTNNPTWEIFWEVTQMCGGTSHNVALTVSVGTGKSRVSRFGKGWLGRYITYLKAAKMLASESEKQHEDMERLARDRGLNYFRFNVAQGLGKMKLDEWKAPNRWGRRENETLKLIRGKTAEYLRDPEVRKNLRTVAEMLVRNRRERASTSRWEFVCLGTQYRCCYPGCPKSQKVRPDSKSLRSHLRKCHKVEDQDKIDRFVERGKCIY